MLFYIKTLGCKVNTYESNYIKETLINKGFFETDIISKADVLILNTCSVTNTADNKSLKTAKSLRKENNKAILIICGCSTQNSHDEFTKAGANIIIGTHNKSKIYEFIMAYKEDTYINICNNSNIEFEDMELSSFEQVRAYIKIQDGCNNYCSYCIIPYVRGNIRFKDYNKVIKEATKLASKGFKEIVLTGIHTGSYPNLVNLINDISNIKGICNIRLSSIEITELTEDFFNLLKNNKVFCNSLHIPLQAGSNIVLKKMNRKYNKEYFENIINKIRSIRKDIYISTDVIVGHPYETEELFLESLEFCKKLNFAKIHVFPYSKRRGTAAYNMENHVSDVDKKLRSKELIKLNNTLEKSYKNKFIGKSFDVLIESKKDNYYIGHTSNFIKVKINGNYNVNDIVNITINKENIL